MTTFLLDLWQDLRAKRLWPLAVGLLAATVAVPVMLFKPATAPPAPGNARPDAGAKLPSVALDASSVENSHLNVFSQKDPFAALKDSTGSTLPGGSSGSGSGGGSGSGSGSTGQSVSSAASGASSSGDTGSTGGGPAPTGPDGSPATPGLSYFAYTADVKFGPAGHAKTYKNVKQLQVLPDGSNPIISFMGVKDGKTAVFFVADPGFSADGEGKCQPDNANCRFIYMKTDADHNEETLSAQGGQIAYTLVLTGLHVDKISKNKAVGDTTPTKKANSSGKRRAKKLPTLLNLPALAAK